MTQPTYRIHAVVYDGQVHPPKLESYATWEIIWARTPNHSFVVLESAAYPGEYEVVKIGPTIGPTGAWNHVAGPETSLDVAIMKALHHG